MSRRLTITVQDEYYVKLLAISRAEHRKPAAMGRLLLEDAMRAGLRPSQRLLFDAGLEDGKPILRLIRGGKNQ